MEKRTVKRRIFISNAMMVIVTLASFFVLNLAIIKIYLKSAETELRMTAEQMLKTKEPGELLENWIFHQNEILLLFAIDGIICIIILVMTSQIFTKNLTKHIMEPLNILAEGAERIKNNDLTGKIQYTGDIEFESVCDTFNGMRESILQEQEKNRKYEKARTDMIAGISHDLRTPLTAVKGTVKGLMDGIASTPKQQEIFLKTAYRRTEEMEALLKQLFYFSKMETGNMPLECKEIAIAEFLQNYVEEKQETMDREQENIVLNDNGIRAEIVADTEQLRRILDNLLENSKKYGEKSPLEIEIVLGRTKKGLDICFKDNGVGVPKEKLSHIFEEFYRGDESRNKQEGNGLGLYIVEYLVKAMGGIVWAENQNGLAVHLELPVKKWKGEKESV